VAVAVAGDVAVAVAAGSGGGWGCGCGCGGGCGGDEFGCVGPAVYLSIGGRYEFGCTGQLFIYRLVAVMGLDALASCLSIDWWQL
jgi:hypothetical protein